MQLWNLFIRNHRQATEPSQRLRGVEFEVSAVRPARRRLRETRRLTAIQEYLRGPRSGSAIGRFLFGRQSNDIETRRPPNPTRLEACSSYRGVLVKSIEFHPVIAAADLAFQEHRPLTLSPDMIWLMITQTFAAHVKEHAEELRHLVVDHDGQLELGVTRDDLIPGSPENAWDEVIDEFSLRIAARTRQDLAELFVARFSTTGPAELTAFRLALMDAMQPFFRYTVFGTCGIPRIRLEGTPEDWASVVDRTRQLSQFGIGCWTNTLIPLLEHFVQASEGRVDRRFWQGIYGREDDCGGTIASGWLMEFVICTNEPTVRPSVRIRNLSDPLPQPSFEDKDEDVDEVSNAAAGWAGANLKGLPTGLSAVPFQFLTPTMETNMEFLGGFVGVRQNRDTLALRPEIGWAVRRRVFPSNR